MGGMVIARPVSGNVGSWRLVIYREIVNQTILIYFYITCYFHAIFCISIVLIFFFLRVNVPLLWRAAAPSRVGQVSLWIMSRPPVQQNKALASRRIDADLSNVLQQRVTEFILSSCLSVKKQYSRLRRHHTQTVNHLTAMLFIMSRMY